MRPHFTWSIVRYRAPATAVDSVLRRNSREYRLVIGDCVICLGPKIEFSRGCAIAFVLALTSAVFGQDAIPISRTNRSILQPEEEAQIQRPTGFTAADHMLGDCGGWRERPLREKQDRHHFIVFQHAHQASSNFGLQLLIFRKAASARTF